jgi:hypothetical protein
MDYSKIQEKLGFSESDKATWIVNNGKYYQDPEQGWIDKLIMHAYPTRTASVYVMPSYQSPISGKWIDTPSQRRDDMARNNARPWEGMESERKAASERVKIEEKQKDAAIENAVVGAYHSLSDDKKSILSNAL